MTLRRQRPREALILIQGALAIALEHDLHVAALRAYNNLAASLWKLDRWREEQAVVNRGLELARRIGDRTWESNFLAGSVGVLNLLGRWDEALERAAEAEELAATEFAQGLALAAALVHGHRGAPDRARELLARHADIAGSENPDFAAGWASLDAAVLAMEGRQKEALEAAHRALEIHRGASPPWVFFAALEAATAAETDDVRELLGRFGEVSGADLTPSLRALQARFRARLPEYDAESELATAERLFTELGAPFHLAVVQLEHAEWLAEHGQAAEAEPLLDEARATFERLQATPWLERMTKAAQVPAASRSA